MEMNERALTSQLRRRRTKGAVVVVTTAFIRHSRGVNERSGAEKTFFISSRPMQSD